MSVYTKLHFQFLNQKVEKRKNQKVELCLAD